MALIQFFFMMLCKMMFVERFSLQVLIKYLMPRVLQKHYMKNMTCNCQWGSRLAGAHMVEK